MMAAMPSLASAMRIDRKELFQPYVSYMYVRTCIRTVRRPTYSKMSWLCGAVRQWMVDGRSGIWHHKFRTPL